MTTKELRESKLKLWKEMRDLNDAVEKEGRAFTAEEQERWDKLNKEFDDLGVRLERAARLDQIENSEADDDDGRDVVRQSGRSVDGETRKEKGGSDDGVSHGPTEEQRSLAVQAWLRNVAGMELEERHVEACRAVGLKPTARQFDVRLMSTAEYNRFRRSYRFEQRDQSTVVLSGGGALVPEGFVNNLERALLEFGGVRRVADVFRSSDGGDLPWPTVNDTSNTGELLAENAAGTEQDVTFGRKVFKAYKYSSKIVPVSFELLEDSAFNFVSILADLLGERLGRITNTHFTTGTGAAQPEGIVIGATTGKTTASATAITSDEIMDLIHSVDPAYRRQTGAGFMMHDNVLLALRKLKTGMGNYIFQPSNNADVADTIHGYPYVINQDMASSVATTNITMLFGSMRHYKIRDIGSMRFKRSDDRYFEQDQAVFIALQRTDGRILNAGTNPIKSMVQA